MLALPREQANRYIVINPLKSDQMPPALPFKRRDREREKDKAQKLFQERLQVHSCPPTNLLCDHGSINTFSVLIFYMYRMKARSCVP